MMNQKVLVIDDDLALVSLLRIGLEREGFSVVTADGGQEGLRRAYETHPDLIVLDIMMPDIDGWTTCERLRTMCNTPIIMLTAKDSQRDVLRGLSLGADDYLTKPYSFEELKARIFSLLRRSNSQIMDNWRVIYDDGNLYINVLDGTVMHQGEPVALTPKESKILMYLVGHKGRVVPYGELLGAVWGPEYEKEVGYLNVYIHYLRLKLEDDPSNPYYIRTRWGLGYYFAEEKAMQ
jgi:two-component system KDP operon response regulator KdpE